jgi:hypothetical protein
MLLNSTYRHCKSADAALCIAGMLQVRDSFGGKQRAALGGCYMWFVNYVVQYESAKQEATLYCGCRDLLCLMPCCSVL